MIDAENEKMKNWAQYFPSHYLFWRINILPVIIIINIFRIYIIHYVPQQIWHWHLNGCSLSQLIVRTQLACKNPIGHTSSIKLFHGNLSSAKRLAASHSNPMSNSFIFIMEIQVVRYLPLGFFVCLREYWSAIFAGVSSERRKRWPSQLSSLLFIICDQGICLVTA